MKARVGSVLAALLLGTSVPAWADVRLQLPAEESPAPFESQKARELKASGRADVISGIALTSLGLAALAVGLVWMAGSDCMETGDHCIGANFEKLFGLIAVGGAVPFLISGSVLWNSGNE